MRTNALLYLCLALGPGPGISCTSGASAAKAFTSTGGDSLLVSTSWLEQHLNDRSLVLVHAGPKEEYLAGHIPGAQSLSLQEISTPWGKGLTLELPPVEQLKSTLERIGISDSSRIVIYFGGDSATPATRVYFTLDFMGLGNQSSILNGGLPAWQKEGRPVTADLPAARYGSFTPHVRPDVVVDAGWIHANQVRDAVAVVDARTPEFYSGVKAGSGKRAGHIPGAVNIPFISLVDESGRFKQRNILIEVFQAAHIKPGSRVVPYCHIGLQASLVYFVAKYLGYETSLYDGSFEDWSAHSDLPVAAAVSNLK